MNLIRNATLLGALAFTLNNASAEICKCNDYIGGPLYTQHYSCTKRSGVKVKGWVRFDDFVKLDKTNIEDVKVDCDVLDQFTFYSSPELAETAYKKMKESKEKGTCFWEQRPSNDIPGATMTILPGYFHIDASTDPSCAVLSKLPNKNGVCFGLAICEGVQKGATCLASAPGKCPSASQCLNKGQAVTTGKAPKITNGSDWGSLTYSDPDITICGASLMVASGGKYHGGTYLGSNGKCETDQKAAFSKATADACFPGTSEKPEIQDYSSIGGKLKSGQGVKSDDT